MMPVTLLKMFSSLSVITRCNNEAALHFKISSASVVPSTPTQKRYISPVDISISPEISAMTDIQYIQMSGFKKFKKKPCRNTVRLRGATAGIVLPSCCGTLDTLRKVYIPIAAIKMQDIEATQALCNTPAMLTFLRTVSIIKTIKTSPALTPKAKGTALR